MSSQHERGDEEAAAFKAMFPAIPDGSDGFSFALMAYTAADKKEVIMVLFCTATGKSWAQMLTWASRVLADEEQASFSLRVTIKCLCPRIDDPDLNLSTLSTPYGIKCAVWSILRSYEQNGPVDFEAIDLLPRADGDLVKVVVRLTLASYLEPGVVPRLLQLEVLGKDLKPLFHIDLCQ